MDVTPYLSSAYVVLAQECEASDVSLSLSPQSAYGLGHVQVVTSVYEVLP